jgi:biotin transport system substrate-specific component
MTENTLYGSIVRPTVARRVPWHVPLAVLGASGLVALCAHIAVPIGFTPVPISMQTFAVLLIGLFFSPAAAFASLSLYLLEGAAGLPVFSPYGPGGIAQLLGPTGGYLLSYPFAAALASLIFRSNARRLPAGIVAVSLASLLILTFGATWLGVVTHAHLSSVLNASVVPFLPGDAIKAAAALACAGLLHSFRKPEA